MKFFFVVFFLTGASVLVTVSWELPLEPCKLHHLLYNLLTESPGTLGLGSIFSPLCHLKNT